MYVRNADGSFQYNANTGYHVYDYGDGSSTNFTRNFMSMSNPMSGFLYDTEKYLMDILNGKWYAKIDIIDGLSLTASLGLHIDNTRQHSVGNKYYVSRLPMAVLLCNTPHAFIRLTNNIC